MAHKGFHQFVKVDEYFLEDLNEVLKRNGDASGFEDGRDES
jgi:hypothetical protein